MVVLDAVYCHFDEGTSPKGIRLHWVRDELLAAHGTTCAYRVI